MLFCKQLLGVKTSTQNDFIYGELGRTNYYTRSYLALSNIGLRLWVQRTENMWSKYTT